MWRLAVFCAVLAVASGQITNMLPCPAHPNLLPLNLHIEGCTQPPCHLPQLQNAVIDIVFQAPRTMRTMTTVATAYLSLFGAVIGVNHDLGDQANACNFLTNTYCPVLQNEIVLYRLLMFIESSFFVGTQATVEFSVIDEFGEIAFCLRVPIRVTPALPGASSQNHTLEYKEGPQN